ncbi:metal ABC transporter ATP-binding protein [Pseudonocardia sp. DSM 110487]|uniref:zinc ABC transporter ATP-binding protein AztA n=1 Tax=Pseudonocardia sp. DSM 110487 TaxID=2865833 RepID=UPI001C6A71A9|nr:zinc ABC transporter ATP-binding protein AztA [Pseudonocardia sp. DSM 110487]QYN32726.1 metal ABC transporter ATP-binding protein [Pseudonocardia sp. DSM 110487]
MSDALVVRDLVAGHGRPALHGINARIPRARVTAVLGPNGAGKSTLLDVLAGVLAPSSGGVERIVGRSPAYVVQRSAAPDTLPITVRATVAMGRWASRGPWRRLTARDRAVVEDCMRRLGVHDLADRSLGTLSGGQRQRALVAQGLAQESDLLLLDEPAAGLDTDARRYIDEALIEEAANGVTVVAVTHDPAAAAQADYCLLLRDGRLMAEGPPPMALLHTSNPHFT